MLYSNANQDAAKQQQQAEAAITQGANVIVMSAVDGKAAQTIVQNAKSQGVPVVAYDRFISGADYYVSFDNKKVGELQGTGLVDAMKKAGKTSGDIVMINGAPTDANAADFKAGAHSVLDNSGYKIAAEFDTPDWSPDKAQAWMESQIGAVKANLVGVYAANDGTGGGAIAALKGGGVNPLPPVTGQDAELAAIQRILAGDQALTIYKAIEPQADGRREEGHPPGQQGRHSAPPSTRTASPPPCSTRSSSPSTTSRTPSWPTASTRSATSAPRSTRTRAPRPASADHRHPAYPAPPSRRSEPSMTTTSPAPVLSMTGVSKRFGAVQALKDIEFSVEAGEVVALVGDNGAGKSTLVKAIAGVYTPDDGQVVFDGSPVEISSPAQAQELGIATVFQDLALCDNLDVVGNLFLGSEVVRNRALDEVTMEKESWRLLRELSAKIPSVRIPVASLSGGQRQTVAIARSLLGKPKVVMLDEPTAALGVAQTAEVLNLVERLRENGLAVILISHNMSDVMAVADRVVVLRLGRNNGEFRVADTNVQEIIAAITGATTNAVSARAARKAPHQEEQS